MTTESTPGDRPVGIRRDTPYSPELESLRGWAILLVFLFHADGAITGFDRLGTTVSPLLAFMTAGHTGVTLFFILSAFLLARPFLEAASGGPPVRLGHFYRRRILRIMPLYTVAVLFAIFFSRENPTALTDGLRALFFLNSFSGTVHSLMPYSAVWWSLATEVQFYLALPILGGLLKSRAGRGIALLVLLAWAAGYAFVVFRGDLIPESTRFRLGLGLPGRAPAFLVGIGLTWLVARHGERLRSALRRRPWLERGGGDLLLLLVLLGLGLLLQKVTARGFVPAELTMPAWHLAESLLWGLVLLLILLVPLRSLPLISNRPFAILGLLSYSLYLIHEPILFFQLGARVQRGLPLASDLPLRIFAIALAFIVCLALSAASYRLIERPFLVRKARIER